MAPAGAIPATARVVLGGAGAEPDRTGGESDGTWAASDGARVLARAGIGPGAAGLLTGRGGVDFWAGLARRVEAVPCSEARLAE